MSTLAALHDPSIYPLGPRRTLVVLGGALLGLLLASFNQTLTVAAVPAMAADLGGLDHYSWIFSAYILAMAVTIPLSGRLSDIHGRRPLFVASILLFGLGSVASGLAPSLAALVLGRAVQGLGAGGLNAVGIAMLADIMAPRERGKWEALNGSVFAASAVGGPLLGGWIVSHASWRVTFFAGLPLAALALAVVWFGFGAQAPGGTPQRVDYAGAALLAAGIGATLAPVSLGGNRFPWRSAPIVGSLLAAAVLLATFVAWERRVAHPLVPLGLLRSRTIVTADAALFAVAAAMFGLITLVPIFVQGVQGQDTTAAGRMLVPALLAWFAGSAVAGRIVYRTSRPRPVLLLGSPVAAAGFGLLVTLGVGAAATEVALAVLVIGFGLGMMTQTLVVVAQSSVPAQLVGVAGASAQLARAMGTAIGVTAMNAVLSAGLGARDFRSAAGDTVADALHPAFATGLGAVLLAFVAILLLPDTILSSRIHAAADRDA